MSRTWVTNKISPFVSPLLVFKLSPTAGEHPVSEAMEYNFNALLDEMIPPQDMLPPVRKPREPPVFTLRPHLFAMGSTQAAIFREEFRVEIDRAIVSLNLAEQTLFFRIPFDDAPYEFPILQAVCSIDDLESVRLVKRGNNIATLTVTLRRPPKIEADFRGIPDAVDSGLRIRRATELDWSPDSFEEGVSGPPGTMPRGCRVRTPMKFGLWLTYSFEFSYRSSELQRVRVALSRLRTLDRPGTDKVAVDPEAEADVVTRTSTGQDPYTGSDTYNVDDLLEKAMYTFDARYLVVGLVSQGLILPIEVADIIHTLWPVPPTTRVGVLRALFRLDRRALVDQLAREQIRKLLRHMPARAREPSLPPGRVSMRRAVVTPTRVLLFPEVIETSNRVLRAWLPEMRAGRFIRVGFADEDGRLRVNKRMAEAEKADPDGGLLARIRNVLHDGCESQLKDHSCWMVCEMGEFTADRVRQQMGDFSKEHVVAKYAARMGLCFSATKHVAELTENDIETLDDIKYDDNKHIYSDGVGNCSQELATKCAEALGSDQKAPSAVQIRMGGIKGVLSVHPHLEKNQVCIRPSMQKFQSDLRGLGVMKVSRFAPAHLNRQAICIMSALGMNTHILLAKFQQQIHHVNNLEKEMQTLDTSRHPAKHVYKNAFIPVTALIKAGLVEQQLLKNVLGCIKCQLLRDLKYKARVMVADGAYLMGIADEYDVLEEGQIYCAITPNGTNSRRVITGQCTIFRSPCIHPGDARLVTAWDFYTVIYDKELQIARVHEPMDYSPVTPVRKDIVHISDVCDFVVDFIRSDVLGLVASDHQALADRFGPQHDDCLELAKYNSHAVDFPKSGVAVHIPGRLRPVRYPDFMGRDPDFSYPSARVLGMMYRLIEPAPEYHPSYDICIDTRISSKRIVPAYLQAAGIMKQNYDVKLEGIMRQHSLCEAEIIAGVSIMSDQKKRRAADDAIRGPVREATESLFSEYRREARRFVKDNPSGNGLENWAIACYQITHIAEHRSRWVDALNQSRRGSTAVSDDGTEDGEYAEVTRRELISFPWVWASEICRSLDDAVIKEEEEEEEDLGWRRPWEIQSDSDEEED
ncbi:RNA dependent RNA polymerase-domain-containing protein [Mycena olivaceomarginata]|nr:RNA dependent RNA polymerase-domain-containing protein [Mycena olivaceomarginata]